MLCIQFKIRGNKQKDFEEENGLFYPLLQTGLEKKNNLKVQENNILQFTM